jgi:hypothetical protein
MSMARSSTETKMRRGEFRSATNGVNTSFLLDIKEDHAEFQVLLKRALDVVQAGQPIKPRALADLLGQLRDEMETYFCLEEFYGGFDVNFETDPSHARMAAKLKHQHEQLFTRLVDLVERAEQIVYHEVPSSRMRQIAADFKTFVDELHRHEDAELDLISRQSSLDLGGGD